MAGFQPGQINNAVKSGAVPKADKEHKCQHCPRSYDEKKNLNKHLRMKHPMEWKAEKVISEVIDLGLQYECDVCKELLNTYQQLKDHRRRKHNKEERLAAKKQIETHKCPHCGRGHTTANALQCHERRCIL